MRTLFSVHTLVTLIFLLIPVGLIFAPFLLSVCMFASAAVAFFALDLRPFRLRIRPTLSEWKTFRTSPQFWMLCGLFVLTFWGSWHVQDWGYWLSRFRIKMPFLVLPFAFFFIPRPDSRTLDGLLYFLVILLALTSMGVLINYLVHMEAINKLIKQGKPIPLPCNHVRYSLMLVFGLLSALYLFFQKYFWRKPWEKYLQLAIAGFLFLFVHILSVRTGLAVLYATLFLLTIRYILKTRQYWLGVGVLVAMLVFPVLAYQAIPSLRAKVDYVKYDLFMYRHGHTDQQLSDAGRWVSLEIGWDIFRRHPSTGVGVANLKKEVNKRYDEWYPDLPDEERKMPHNQFLSMFGAGGLLGGFLFTGIFFFPVFYKKNYRHWLLLGLYLIVSLSFLVENTIENAMGVGFFVYYALHLLLRFTMTAPAAASDEV